MTTSEVIDLGNEKTTCDNLQDYPEANFYGSGGLLSGNTPLICGGSIHKSWRKPTASQCFTLESTVPRSLMYVRRMRAASIVTDGGNSLWITGGFQFKGAVIRKTTEFVSLNGTRPGPDLPMPVHWHCLAKINETSAIMIGGEIALTHNTSMASNKTWFYNFNTTSWTPGPSLDHARETASCGLITDSADGSKMVVITGGFTVNDTYMNSTEVLVLGSNEWMGGPDLPEPLDSAPGITTSDGKSFLFVGGMAQSGYRSSIYRLQCFHKKCHWNKMKQTLSQIRSSGVAMLIPDSMANCREK